MKSTSPVEIENSQLDSAIASVSIVPHPSICKYGEFCGRHINLKGTKIKDK